MELTICAPAITLGDKEEVEVLSAFLVRAMCGSLLWLLLSAVATARKSPQTRREIKSLLFLRIIIITVTVKVL